MLFQVEIRGAFTSRNDWAKDFRMIEQIGHLRNGLPYKSELLEV